MRAEGEALDSRAHEHIVRQGTVSVLSTQLNRLAEASLLSEGLTWVVFTLLHPREAEPRSLST